MPVFTGAAHDGGLGSHAIPLHAAQGLHKLKVNGVSRLNDDPRCVVVALNERPTDDELRRIHNAIRESLS